MLLFFFISHALFIKKALCVHHNATSDKCDCNMIQTNSQPPTMSYMTFDIALVTNKAISQKMLSSVYFQIHIGSTQFSHTDLAVLTCIPSIKGALLLNK